MAILAVGLGEDTKRKASSHYLCNDHIEAFVNLVFA